MVFSVSCVTIAFMKKNRITKIILIVLGILVSLCLLAVLAWKVMPREARMSLIKMLSRSQVVRDVAGAGVKETYNDKVRDERFEEESIAVTEEAEKKLTGYTNILLFGIDSRDSSFDQGTNSDSMIIVSINNDTGSIRMASVYRDTYLKLIGDSKGEVFRKANAAYARGGAAEAISTLNTNLDLNISDYVIVNFAGLSEIVDIFGGVDIHVSEREKELINSFSDNMADEAGLPAPAHLAAGGDVHLTGLQTTAFCRIRSAVFTDEDGREYHYDYGRTARQRYVMKRLMASAKTAGVTQLLSMADAVMNLNSEDRTVIRTSLSYDSIMDLVPYLIDYRMEGSTGFPYTLLGKDVEGDDAVVPCGLAYNVTELHRFLFDDESYAPSETVQTISEQIIARTGVGEKTLEAS